MRRTIPQPSQQRHSLRRCVTPSTAAATPVQHRQTDMLGKLTARIRGVRARPAPTTVDVYTKRDAQLALGTVERLRAERVHAELRLVGQQAAREFKQ